MIARRPISSSSLALTALAAMLGSSGCDFVDAATEQTFGEGQIPRFAEEFLWPSIDELSGLDQAQMEAIPGFFPSSFGDGTLAHLQGALEITGDCERRLAMAAGGSTQVGEGSISLVSCSATDARCGHRCPVGYSGLMLETRIVLKLLDAEKAAKLKDSLSQLTPDAIAQIRLRLFELELFRETGAERIGLNDHLSVFELAMADAEGNEIVLIERQHLDAISAETPQRFDIDSRAPFTRKLKEGLIAAQPLEATLVLRVSIDQPDLYDMVIDGTGLAVDVQPEFVLSVLEVVKSAI